MAYKCTYRHKSYPTIGVIYSYDTEPFVPQSYYVFDSKENVARCSAINHASHAIFGALLGEHLLDELIKDYKAADLTSNLIEQLMQEMGYERIGSEPIY